MPAHLGVSMDSNASLSPLLQSQSFPTSPSAGSRKRSIHEVDDVAPASPESKRPLVSYDSENQENRDPSQSMHVGNMSPPSQASQGSSPPVSRVEVVIKSHPGSGDGTTTPSTRTVGVETQLSTTPNPVEGSPAEPEPASAAATKKRKLSPASKEAKQHEKELKERQKLEEKARREEEKRLKEEEKKKREAEREEEKRLKEEEKKQREAEREEERKRRDEKKKAKDDEKAAKEEEKRKREEEKEKKARSQMKLNSFFAKPSLPSASPQKANASPSKASASGEPAWNESSHGSQSDYAREFPGFFLQSHTTLAPCHRFERDAEALNHVRHTVDACLSSNNDLQQLKPFRPSEIFQLIPFRRRRGRQIASVKEILLRIQSLNDGVMPAEGSEFAKPGADPQDLLRKVPLKSLKFSEDVRPPYQGTYTRSVPESSAKKLSRNPYHQALPDTNYDYDSEAEWEEPEEGEDLDSEEEEDVSDDGDDDLDGFLDDEDDALVGGKRRLIVGDLEPVCSGIRWAAHGVDAEFQEYQIETISEAVKFPIDPLSTVYWQKPRSIDQGSAKARAAQNALPRSQTLHASWGSPGPEGPAVGAALPTATSKAKRPFPPEQLDEFKQAVEGSDLSKIGLVEILKKRFPKVSKDTLKATLDQVAARVGQKEADKKWVCR